MGLRRTGQQGSGEDYITRSFMIVLTKYYCDDQMKRNNVDGACSTYGRQERYIQGFWQIDLRENLGTDERIILKRS